MESTANGCVDRVIYIIVLQLAEMQKQLHGGGKHSTESAARIDYSIWHGPIASFLVDGLEADVAAGAAALQAKDGELSMLLQQLAAMQKQLEEATTAQSLLQESITQSDSDEGLEERELD